MALKRKDGYLKGPIFWEEARVPSNKPLCTPLFIDCSRNVSNCALYGHFLKLFNMLGQPLPVLHHLPFLQPHHFLCLFAPLAQPSLTDPGERVTIVPPETAPKTYSKILLVLLLCVLASLLWCGVPLVNHNNPRRWSPCMKSEGHRQGRKLLSHKFPVPTLGIENRCPSTQLPQQASSFSWLHHGFLGNFIMSCAF